MARETRSPAKRAGTPVRQARSDSAVCAPKIGRQRIGTSTSTIPVRTKPPSRLISIATRRWLSSMLSRCTSAEANPSKVRMPASGTKINATAAWPNCAGVISRASSTMQPRARVSLTTRVSITQRTPLIVASWKELRDMAVCELNALRGTLLASRVAAQRGHSARVCDGLVVWPRQRSMATAQSEVP